MTARWPVRPCTEPTCRYLVRGPEPRCPLHTLDTRSTTDSKDTRS
jgi:hypothetical protein